MLHRYLFLMLSLLAFSFAFSQTTPVGNADLIKQTPVLKALADNVNTAHAELAKVSTGTRTTGTDAKKKYDSALSAYLTELEHQLTLASERDKVILENEIATVKQLQAGTLKTTTK